MFDHLREGGMPEVSMSSLLSQDEVPSLETIELAGKIRAREIEANKTFFGKEIDVPPLPAQATAEKIKAWEAKGLGLHFLPTIDLAKETDIPGWKQRPDTKAHLESIALPPEFMKIQGGWRLIDERDKPDYLEEGDQLYDHDVLGPVLAELRAQNLVKPSHTPNSRFKVTPGELKSWDAQQAIAKAYGVKAEQLALPTAMEFSLLANMHHPEWGKSDTSEMFGDRYNGGQEYLFGGHSGHGGLTHIDRHPSSKHAAEVAFRFFAHLR